MPALRWSFDHRSITQKPGRFKQTTVASLTEHFSYVDIASYMAFTPLHRS